jgi:hypothetical protein
MMNERKRMALTIAAVAAFAVVVLATGCGIGSSPESSIARTADDYLRALSSGDTKKACAQLTADARFRLGTSCEIAMARIAAEVGSVKLEDAADGSVDVSADGKKGTATVHELHGATLLLKKDGFDWKIDDGYRLSS